MWRKMKMRQTNKSRTEKCEYNMFKRNLTISIQSKLWKQNIFSLFSLKKICNFLYVKMFNEQKWLWWVKTLKTIPRLNDPTQQHYLNVWHMFGTGLSACPKQKVSNISHISKGCVTKPRSWFWLLWDYWWAWSPMFLSAHHLYQAHLFHIMQSTLSSTPVPHHAINSPIKASSTFQSPPDRCTTQYEYMPANLCPEVFVFCQFLRNWELTRFSLSWLQKSSLNLWLRSLTRTLEHRVLEPGPQTLYPTRAFTTQFTSLFVNKLTLIVL